MSSLPPNPLAPVLLDTDVYSYLSRPGDERGDLYRLRTAGRLLTICYITLGEVLYGIQWRKWGERIRADLEASLKATVVLLFDHEVCYVYATLKSELRQQGRMLADNDTWIASFALRHSMPLVSNNRRHFERIPGLTLISEAPQ